MARSKLRSATSFRFEDLELERLGRVAQRLHTNQTEAARHAFKLADVVGQEAAAGGRVEIVRADGTRVLLCVV